MGMCESANLLAAVAGLFLLQAVVFGLLTAYLHRAEEKPDRKRRIIAHIHRPNRRAQYKIFYRNLHEEQIIPELRWAARSIAVLTGIAGLVLLACALLMGFSCNKAVSTTHACRSGMAWRASPSMIMSGTSTLRVRGSGSPGSD